MPPAVPPVLRRNLRYLGDNLGVSLDELQPDDAAAVQEAYQTLQSLLQVLKRALSGNSPLLLLRHARESALDEKLAALNKRLRAISWEGAASPEQALRVLRSVRDASGGAWASLLAAVDLVILLNTEIQHADVLRVFYLTRDQLKILRNCFPSLDPERARLDRELNFHSTKLLREKWDGFQASGKTVRVFSDADAAIACCCLEFSTLDRVLYNLVLFTAALGTGDELAFRLNWIKGRSASDLLILLETTLTHETATALKTSCGGNDLRALFEGRHALPTSIPSEGLQICLDCVCNAWGYTSAAEALDAQLAALTINEKPEASPLLLAWFFWPAMADTPALPTACPAP